jgi:hypothetical protein
MGRGTCFRVALLRRLSHSAAVRSAAAWSTGRRRDVQAPAFFLSRSRLLFSHMHRRTHAHMASCLVLLRRCANMLFFLPALSFPERVLFLLLFASCFVACPPQVATVTHHLVFGVILLSSAPQQVAAFSHGISCVAYVLYTSRATRGACALGVCALPVCSRLCPQRTTRSPRLCRASSRSRMLALPPPSGLCWLCWGTEDVCFIAPHLHLHPLRLCC